MKFDVFIAQDDSQGQRALACYESVDATWNGEWRAKLRSREIREIFLSVGIFLSVRIFLSFFSKIFFRFSLKKKRANKKGRGPLALMKLADLCPSGNFHF